MVFFVAAKPPDCFTRKEKLEFQRSQEMCIRTGCLRWKPNFFVKECILLYYPRYALSDCHSPHCLSLSQANTQHQTTEYVIEHTMLI